MKVILIGYGKMGKAIEDVIIELQHQVEGIEIINRISADNISDLSIANLEKADVAIEFTRPETAVRNIKLCMDAKIPVVAGTTGWYQHLSEIKDYCSENNGALLYAPNFSIGVNIFFELNKKIASIMLLQSQYDIRLEETHHTQKLDAPSGTAVKLAEDILENSERKRTWVNNKTINESELEIISHRIDNIPGTHEVIYSSGADEIKLVHTAFSRKGFAEGAVTAAKWLVGKKGVYTMKDVLQF